ncbi:hypothetical protein EMIT0P258_90040 [Pseudomonas sp. IT-P258]
MLFLFEGFFDVNLCQVGVESLPEAD